MPSIFEESSNSITYYVTFLRSEQGSPYFSSYEIVIPHNGEVKSRCLHHGNYNDNGIYAKYIFLCSDDEKYCLELAKNGNLDMQQIAPIIENNIQKRKQQYEEDEKLINILFS